jgi:hypothetical protein
MKRVSTLLLGLMSSYLVIGQGQITTNLKTTWEGNTFNGPKWVQEWIKDMVVKPDGTVYATCDWDEGVGGSRHGAFKDCDVLPDKSMKVNSKLCVDSAGNTWTIENFYGRFSSWNPLPVPTGILAPYIKCTDGRTINDIVDPSAIAIDNFGRLMVADNGPDQNIKIYDIKTGTPVKVKEFGDKGGVLSGTPGIIAPLKFHGIRGLGTDSLGNIWVGNSGWPMQQSGTDLRRFTPDGTMTCNLLAKIFVKSGEPDPDSLSELYMTYEHVSVDYDNAIPGTWKYVATTMDPFKYPDDFRVGGSSVESAMVRRINGHKYLFLTNMYVEFLAVYRFEGEIAVPAALFSVGWDGQWMKYPWQSDKRPQWDPSKNEGLRWMWRDNNGDGQVQADEFSTYNLKYPYIRGLNVDKSGNISIGARTLTVFPANGIDAHGVPNYSVSTLVQTPSILSTPNNGGDLVSLKYIDDQDVMYIGSDGSYPSFGSIYKFKDWSKSPTLVWKDSLGYDAATFTADDKYVYVTGYSGTKHLMNTGVFDVLTADSGKYVGYIKPGSEVGFQSGSIDLPYSLQTAKRPNGERLIFMEDDWKGKIIIYNWCPEGNCSEPDFKISLLSPKPDSVYLQSNDVLIEAKVDAGSTPIDSVEFYVDYAKAGIKVASPYTFTWTSPSAGMHVVSAKAVAHGGKTATTSYLNLKVSDGKPEIFIEAPYADANYSILDNITFSARANDYDGKVDKVEFFMDGNLTQTITATPYKYIWDKPVAGQFQVYAKVTDNDGNTASSGVINLNVTDKIGGSFTSPVNQSMISEGEGFNIQLKDSGFTNVKNIAFYNGDNLLATINAAPYSYSVTNATAGIYNLSATVTLMDDRQAKIAGPSVFVMANNFDCDHTGMMNMDFWFNVDGSSVSLIPLDKAPSQTSMANIFEGPTNYADSYGERMAGYICPPQTGDYYFWTSGDDNNQVRIKLPNEDTLRTICRVDGWTPFEAWDNSPSQKSEAITLQQGQMYLIEGLLKEGGGGDNFAAGWQLPDGTLERPIPGKHLIPLYNPLTLKDDVVVNITSPADGAKFTINDTIQFTAEVVKGESEVTQVKFFNGIKVLGVSTTPVDNVYSFSAKLPKGTYKLSANGLYRYLIPVASQSLTFTVNTSNGLNNDEVDEDFTVAPNPLFEGKVRISYPEGTKQLIITDITGKVILQQNVKGTECDITADKFSSNGVYIVKVVTNQKTMNKKLIVNK